MSKPAPSSFLNGAVALAGTGDRVVKMGFVSIQVYSLAFYVDKDGARRTLSSYRDRSHDDLVGDSEFYTALVKAPIQKVFRFTFCRALGKDKIQHAFESALLTRLRGDDANAAAKQLIDKFVPGPGFNTDEVACLVFHADGKTIEALHQLGGQPEPVKVARVESGGEGGVWVGFQNVFFDKDTQMPAIKQGAVAQLPALLEDGQAGKGRGPTQADVEMAALQSMGTQGTRTWKEKAGRTDGSEGYKFGDVSRHLYRKVAGKDEGHRKGAGREERHSKEDPPANPQVASLEKKVNSLSAELGDALVATKQSFVFGGFVCVLLITGIDLVLDIGMAPIAWLLLPVYSVGLYFIGITKLVALTATDDAAKVKKS